MGVRRTLKKELHFNFMPGPSRILPGLEQAAAEAFRDGAASWSHRSPDYMELMRRLDGRLRELLDVPGDWRIFLVSSSSYAMELGLRNLTRERAGALVYGAFSERFARIAELCGRDVRRVNLPPGSSLPSHLTGRDTRRELRAAMASYFAADHWRETEAWLLTHNETATGCALPLEDLPPPDEHDPLRLVDCVSSAGALPLPLERADLWLFGVQKAFGCPPGHAVLLVSPRAFARSEELAAEGCDTGCWFSFPRMAEHAALFQAPCTPNVLGVVLLEAACRRLAEVGMDEIQRVTRLRAETLYDWLDSHPMLEPQVPDPADRSLTVVAARRRDGGECGGLLDGLRRRGFLLGAGYGSMAGAGFRIASFPAHRPEDLEILMNEIDGLLISRG